MVKTQSKVIFSEGYMEKEYPEYYSDIQLHRTITQFIDEDFTQAQLRRKSDKQKLKMIEGYIQSYIYENLDSLPLITEDVVTDFAEYIRNYLKGYLNVS